MKTNSLLGVIVMLTLSILVIGSVLVPYIDEVRVTAGTSAEISNTGTYLFEAPNPTTITYDYDTTTFTINDETLSKTPASLYVLSDNFTMRTTSGSGNVFYLTTSSSESPGNFDFEITYDGSSLVMVKTSTSAELVNVEATWLYVSTADGDFTSTVSTNEVYYSAESQVLARGYYGTGDLDTTYWITPDGMGTGAGYEISYEWVGDLVDGTTNLYRGYAVVTISDGTTTETFTPYNYAVSSDVSYNLTSGAEYSLYGIIPLLVIVAVMVSAVYVIFRNKDY